MPKILADGFLNRVDYPSENELYLTLSVPQGMLIGANITPTLSSFVLIVGVA